MREEALTRMYTLLHIGSVQFLPPTLRSRSRCPQRSTHTGRGSGRGKEEEEEGARARGGRHGAQ